MNKIKLFTQKLLKRPLALVLVIAIVVATVPVGMLIAAWSNNKNDKIDFNESVTNEFDAAYWTAYEAAANKDLLLLRGEWDDEAITSETAPAGVTIAFKGEGIALQTTREDRMTVSVDGSLPFVVNQDEGGYYTATNLQDGVLHTITVWFAGVGTLQNIYLRGTDDQLFNANEDVDYYTQSIDGFEKLDNWNVKANDYALNDWKTEGENALRVSTTASQPTLTALYSKAVELNKDIKGLQFDLNVADVTDILNITVQLASSKSPAQTGWMWNLRANQLMNGWNTVSLPFKGATDERSTAPNLVYDHFVIYITAKAGTALFLDNLVSLYQPAQRVEYILLDGESLHDDDIRTLNGAAIDTTNPYTKKGSYKITQATGVPTVHTNAAPFIASVDPNATEVFFYLYIPEGQKKTFTAIRIEMTSSGQNDKDAYEWTINPVDIKDLAEDKWHKISLDFAKASKKGTPNLSALNFVRIYTFAQTDNYFYVDDFTIKGSVYTTAVTNNIGKKDETVLDATGYFWRTECQSDDRNTKVTSVAVASTPALNEMTKDDGEVYDMTIKKTSAYSIAEGKTNFASRELYCAPNTIELDIKNENRFLVQFDVFVPQASLDTAEALGKDLHVNLELGSNGIHDSYEREYVQYLKKEEGWQTVSFNVGSVKTTFLDLHAINTMRIYLQIDSKLESEDIALYLDNIKLVNKDVSNKITIAENVSEAPQWITTATDVNASNVNTMKYETPDSVVAVVNVCDYGADPTGYTDSTKAINMAIKACYRLGGGTIWMPAGNYLVTDTVTLYPLCTLRGDWNNPDANDFNGDYGTVIWARPESSTATNTGLFVLSASAGVEGLTVYYPDQDIRDVRPYPYTFYLDPNDLQGHRSYMLRSLRNITMINSYRGIGTKHNEMTMLSNVKGTVLKCGLDLGDTADVGTIDGVTFKPDYWVNAAYAMRTATRDQIVKWCKDHASSGMRIVSIEQQQFTNITIQGHAYGMLFPNEPARFMGSGPMYNINISDCTYGMYVEAGTYESTTDYASNTYPTLTPVDWRSGYNIVGGKISGTKYSIYNASTPVRNQADDKWYVGSFMLVGVTIDRTKVYDASLLSGSAAGISVYFSTLQTTKPSELVVSDDHIAPAVPTAKANKTTGTNFRAVEVGASEAEIQAALNEVGNGGGIVYVPAGRYLINRLTVPANVELMGAAGVAQRIASLGTVFEVNTGHSTSQAWNRDFLENFASEYKTKVATIQLGGDDAGVSGIFFLYDENIISIDKEQGAFSFYPYTIRGTSADNFVVDCAIAGASFGVELTGANYNVQNLVTATTRQSIKVAGDNGTIRNCLHNGNLLYRTGLNDELNVWEGGNTGEGSGGSVNSYFDGGVYSKQEVNYITVGEGSGQKLINCFIYGGNSVVKNEGATDLLAVNFGTDATGGTEIDSHANFMNNSGTMTVYNPVITGGDLYTGSGITIYNVSKLLTPGYNVQQ